MTPTRSIVLSTGIALSLATFALVGCGKQSETSSATGTSSPAATPKGAHDDHDHDHDHGAPKDGMGSDDHDHDADQADDDHHGPTVQLGEQTSNGFTIKASRDGEITAGGDAAIDVWVTGAASKVAAVRFWIGTQDAKGSMKAKAELEKDNWHTHADVPSPLPAGSRLWIEIETEKPEKFTVGFDLKN